MPQYNKQILQHFSELLDASHAMSWRRYTILSDVLEATSDTADMSYLLSNSHLMAYLSSRDTVLDDVLQDALVYAANRRNTIHWNPKTEIPRDLYGRLASGIKQEFSNL